MVSFKNSWTQIANRHSKLSSILLHLPFSKITSIILFPLFSSLYSFLSFFRAQLLIVPHMSLRQSEQWAETPFLSYLQIYLPRQPQFPASLLFLRMKLTVPIKGQLLPCVLDLIPSHFFKMSPFAFSSASSVFHFPLTNFHQYKNRLYYKTNN